MKRVIFLFGLILNLSIYAQVDICTNYLSESLFSRSNMIGFGARAYYDRNNGTDSYIHASFNILPRLTIGSEVNFQSQIFDFDRKVILVNAQYQIINDLSMGSFLNFETKKYGFTGSYGLSFNNYQFYLKGVTDLSFADYIYSLSISREIVNNLSLQGEFLISEGIIQSNIDKSLYLLSFSVNYTIATNLSLFGSFGFNLKDQYEYNIVDNENVITLGTKLIL